MYRGRVSNDEARQRSGNAENAGPEKKERHMTIMLAMLLMFI